MCTICGCGETETLADQAHEHDHAHTHTHSAGHHQQHDPLKPDHAHHADTRLIEIEKNILSKNNAFADANKRLLRDQNIFCVNLLSGPGSGKTTLLTTTLQRLKHDFSLAVIEGDQETSRDAERIRETGIQALQINTGKGCHLDAHQIGHGVQDLSPDSGSMLFVENVGNLVCPAEFDLGEDRKVVIISVTEGEDKPIKYQAMFAAADLMIINKIDLLPYVQFDVQRCIEYARNINPALKVLQLSATTGEGLDGWIEWLKLNHALKQL